MTPPDPPSAGAEARAIPLRPRRQDAVTAFLRTARRIEDQRSRVIGSKGISPQQYNVLWVLRDAGEAGLATLTIADRMVDRAPGITRLVDRLERRGLVRRARGSDRRRVLCHLTPGGLELLASLDEAVIGTDDLIFASLTHNEVAALVHLLERVRGALK